MKNKWEETMMMFSFPYYFFNLYYYSPLTVRTNKQKPKDY